MHIRASRRAGAGIDLDETEVKEALLHVAVYAGVPAANRAFAVAKSAYAELEASPDSGSET